MIFNDFLVMWRNNTLNKDAIWRNYDILKAIGPEHVKPALKKLGLSYAGELALPQFMHLYGVNDRLEAEAILSSWWLHQRLESSRGRLRVARRLPGRV